MPHFFWQRYEKLVVSWQMMRFLDFVPSIFPNRVEVWPIGNNDEFCRLTIFDPKHLNSEISIDLAEFYYPLIEQIFLVFGGARS